MNLILAKFNPIVTHSSSLQISSEIQNSETAMEGVHLQLIGRDVIAWRPRVKI